MKHLLLTLLAFLFMSLPAQALEIETGTQIIKTDRVVKVCGLIMPPTYTEVSRQAKKTYEQPGDRIVLIRSQGGRVDVGAAILQGLLWEKAQGHRLVCVVDGYAHSMAFNILSFCDVRYATPFSTMIMHKVALGGVDKDVRLTAEYFHHLAKELEETDAPWKAQNSSALKMSSADYDLYADEEHQWTTFELINRGYLAGLVTLRGDTCK